MAYRTWGFDGPVRVADHRQIRRSEVAASPDTREAMGLFEHLEIIGNINGVPSSRRPLYSDPYPSPPFDGASTLVLAEISIVQR